MRQIKNPKMRRTHWTPEMDAKLKALWGSMPASVVGGDMNLTDGRVRARAKKLGLSYPGIRKIYQPPRRDWIDIATKMAREAKLSPKDVIRGCKLRAVARVRWAAYQEVLDRHPNCSIAGLARMTGFDHTGILHGLRRIKGASPSEARMARASGRCPVLRPASFSEARV